MARYHVPPRQAASPHNQQVESSTRRIYRIRSFVLDRLPYIIAFYIALIFAILVISLELHRDSSMPNFSNLLYIIVLATAVIFGWLAWDYARQRSYYRQVADMLAADKPTSLSMVSVRDGVTREQLAMQHLLEQQHKAFADELADYRRQREQHLHFTNQWVHHMKTPVSVIDLLLQQEQASQRQGTDEEEAEDLAFRSSVREELERISRGLEMMLHTARLDHFNMDVRIERVSLLPLIRDMINSHKKACIRTSIFPRVDGSDTVVETDAKWLTFILGQFMTNAIKYSKNKPGSKTLLFKVTPESNGGCSLSVTDQGIGIAEHDLPRVFDPFFTGENGRLIEESTGMGLYLAREVCRRLGHDLAIESELGVGTTITIYFHNSAIHQGLFL
ncbi:signal transduction histidine kinase [Paenibacillus cellulosilyticus]|uniref:histidine kinase n=1 Tax=Paenibacillus cellulosilyticus TaxID=375489 RepID=A0A2V2YJD4_9BACL|nr:sensor histidine kinase [Paenibacillus cellulosilyticus]PWV92084.1 signal transduction histidine kinase [Paenibacillus cellulosilyticus]QKS44194.1 sensor histidine kinase [Paenibacillus cellulosilyticus]